MLQLWARAPLFSREDTSSTPLAGASPRARVPDEVFSGILSTSAQLPVASAKSVAVIFYRLDDVAI
jgi:hypothetical protein